MDSNFLCTPLRKIIPLYEPELLVRKLREFICERDKDVMFFLHEK